MGRENRRDIMGELGAGRNGNMKDQFGRWKKGCTERHDFGNRVHFRVRKKPGRKETPRNLQE